MVVHSFVGVFETTVSPMILLTKSQPFLASASCIFNFTCKNIGLVRDARFHLFLTHWEILAISSWAQLSTQQRCSRSCSQTVHVMIISTDLSCSNYLDRVIVRLRLIKLYVLKWQIARSPYSLKVADTHRCGWKGRVNNFISRLSKRWRYGAFCYPIGAIWSFCLDWYIEHWLYPIQKTSELSESSKPDVGFEREKYHIPPHRRTVSKTWWCAA